MSVTNNSGATIQGDNGSGINIDGFNANELVTVVNHGVITGNGVTGDGDGVDVDGLVHLTNTGTIRSLNAFSQPRRGQRRCRVGGGTITNSGTIEGSVAAGNVNAVGRGITLAGVDTSGTPEPIYADSVVTNSGVIKGQTDSAIVVLGAASGFTVTINNEAGGTIEGGGDMAAAIQTGADNDTLNNAGDVIADASGKAIDLGDGDDTLNITGGNIQGDISAGRHEYLHDRSRSDEFLHLHRRDFQFRQRRDKKRRRLFLRGKHLHRHHDGERRHPYRREHHRKCHRQRPRTGDRRHAWRHR